MDSSSSFLFCRLLRLSSSILLVIVIESPTAEISFKREEDDICTQIQSNHHSDQNTSATRLVGQAMSEISSKLILIDDFLFSVFVGGDFCQAENND